MCALLWNETTGRGVGTITNQQNTVRLTTINPRDDISLNSPIFPPSFTSLFSIKTNQEYVKNKLFDATSVAIIKCQTNKYMKTDPSCRHKGNQS